MSVQVVPVDKAGVEPLSMPDRFRHEITYFMSIPGENGIPKLPHGEYWVRLAEAREWLDEGVVSLVSPLDSENKTELEISEEQEVWLEWMVKHEIEHIRLT
ncbi:MAG: hypothetical protein KDA37_17560 [Planctomycetales bacterium]|nr:hypothetical protein [Planctomycetales bacterium]